MTTIEKQLKGDIMSTDTYLCLSSDSLSSDEILNDLKYLEKSLREFEEKYSRFKKDNILWNFNHAENIKVEKELLDILKLAKYYFERTNGMFDPTILASLINEGYAVGKQDGFKGNSIYDVGEALKYSFSDIKIDYDNNLVKKPIDLFIDLGGIGKGYIVDLLSDFITKKYDDFCISMGGDMYAGGKDRKNEYDYWAIEIEVNGFTNEFPTLLLKNKAVATSGTYKRRWKHDGKESTHIIDSSTGKSIKTDLISATVVGEDTAYCDVYAKYLMMLGLEKSVQTCKDYNIASVIVDYNGDYLVSNEMEKYVWKNK